MRQHIGQADLAGRRRIVLKKAAEVPRGAAVFGDFAGAVLVEGYDHRIEQVAGGKAARFGAGAGQQEDGVGARADPGCQEAGKSGDEQQL